MNIRQISTLITAAGLLAGVGVPVAFAAGPCDQVSPYIDPYGEYDAAARECAYSVWLGESQAPPSAGSQKVIGPGDAGTVYEMINGGWVPVSSSGGGGGSSGSYSSSSSGSSGSSGGSSRSSNYYLNQPYITRLDYNELLKFTMAPYGGGMQYGPESQDGYEYVVNPQYLDPTSQCGWSVCNPAALPSYPQQVYPPH